MGRTCLIGRHSHGKPLCAAAQQVAEGARSALLYNHCHFWRLMSIQPAVQPAGLRQVAEADGRPFKQLVAVQPQEDLHAFVERLCVSEVSMAPVLTTENTGALPCQLSCIAQQMKASPCCFDSSQSSTWRPAHALYCFHKTACSANMCCSKHFAARGRACSWAACMTRSTLRQ